MIKEMINEGKWKYRLCIDDIKYDVYFGIHENGDVVFMDKLIDNGHNEFIIKPSSLNTFNIDNIEESKYYEDDYKDNMNIMNNVYSFMFNIRVGDNKIEEITIRYVDGEVKHNGVIVDYQKDLARSFFIFDKDNIINADSFSRYTNFYIYFYYQTYGHRKFKRD